MRSDDNMNKEFNVSYEVGNRIGVTHLIAVPRRVAFPTKFLCYANESDGVWWASREEVAGCCRRQHAAHIPRQPFRSS
jgi:hypothetical protein